MTIKTIIHNTGSLLTPIFAIATWTILCVIIGRWIERDHAYKIAMYEVEEKVHYSVMTGKPFMFNEGRMGIIMDTKTQKNGKTIAFRVISYVLPEDEEYQFVPVEHIRKPQIKKKKFRTVSKITSSVVGTI